MFAYKLLFFLFLSKFTSGQYEPNWDSLDGRPLPEWYDKAKVGIFLHWGVYSVPSLQSEWFWMQWSSGDSVIVDYMDKYYPPDWTYQDFARDLKAEFYDPNFWADLFEQSGAKYVVLTSKHHEGYTLWPSTYAYSWNAYDVGPHRDLLGELATAIKSKNLHFGTYYSLLEWFHPLYEQDKANNWNTSEFVDSKIMPELKELVTKYEPEVIWSDGNWEASDIYWKSMDFLTWLYNESPVKDTVVVNDRWGANTMCTHGGVYTCADRYNPGVLQPNKWEDAMTIDTYSWGYRRNMVISDLLTIEDLLTTLIQAVSCGGNILINVGPTKEGTIIPSFQERLLQLGSWLAVNGEAIYESNPWTVQNDTLTPNVWYTAKNTTVYATVLFWPEENTLELGAVGTVFDASVTLLGYDEELTWDKNDDVVTITFPDKATVNSDWAWVLKMEPTAATSKI